ncbi:MAG: hypothetical protein HYT87_12955 [Nitrospirae bacterium]|nr:hypothetical protein [Nitrospirota bacterium]
MNDQEASASEVFGPVICSYTRAQALEDGVLVDVSETAKEAGIRYPVALTRAVWGKYVEIPPGVTGQDEKGRLWDVLWMLRWQMRRANGSTCLFKLHVRSDNREVTPPLVTLKAICSPGDTPEPVITIMLPNED